MDILQRMPRFDQDLYKKECEKNYDADAVAGNVEDLTKAAVLLFLGFVDGATSLSASSGGGGGNPVSGWGQDLRRTNANGHAAALKWPVR